MDKRVNVKIVIEHAGPDWVVEKTGVDIETAHRAIESANFLAPRGATVHIEVTSAE